MPGCISAIHTMNTTLQIYLQVTHRDYWPYWPYWPLIHDWTLWHGVKCKHFLAGNYITIKVELLTFPVTQLHAKVTVKIALKCVQPSLAYSGNRAHSFLTRGVRICMRASHAYISDKRKRANEIAHIHS